MFNKAPWGVVLFLGLAVPAFSRSHTSFYRESRQKESAKQQSVKLPLSELLTEREKTRASGNRREMLKIYEQIYNSYPNSDAAPEAYFCRGELYENNREFSSAMKMFSAVIEKYPGSVWFAPAIEHGFAVAKSLQSGTRPRYFGIIPGLKDYTSAVKNYELVVKYAPYSRLAPQALFEIAKLHQRGKHHEQAIDALERVIDLYPDSQEVPDAYLRIAEIYSSVVKGVEYNQGGALAARRYYREFLSLFPLDARVPEVQQRIRELEEAVGRSKIALGDFYFNACYNDIAAKRLYRLAIDFAPYTLSAEVAKEKIDAIEHGKKPKTTAVDFLFPSYMPKQERLALEAAAKTTKAVKKYPGSRRIKFHV
ncbi:MAG: tetratricopeptide repeat protein [Verrucomicrobiota bacterium]|nr:MAG: tetratricopeptide repeat protein [Verrucomicrobiota bacterium]